MLLRQGIHPRGQEQIQFFDWEFIQDTFQDTVDFLLPHLQTAARYAGHIVPLGNIGPNRPGSIGIGIGRV